MKCAVCETEGLTSKLYQGLKVRRPGRAAEWWDEDGNFHNHEGTTTVTPFFCSRGHRTEHIGRTACPTCGRPVDPATEQSEPPEAVHESED